MPTRGELTDRLKTVRPDLKFMWLPFPYFRTLGSILKIGLKCCDRRRRRWTCMQLSSRRPTIQRLHEQ